MIHPSADIHPSAVIGEGTNVWQGAAVMADCVIGKGCNIGRNVEIGRGSVIGDGTRIGTNTFLPPNSRIGKNVFLGPSVTCTDDRHPKVPKPGDPPYDARPPKIGHDAAIGAGVVLLPGISIGVGARVAAASVVTKDVPDYCAVRGGPARFFTPPAEWDLLADRR